MRILVGVLLTMSLSTTVFAARLNCKAADDREMVVQLNGANLKDATQAVLFNYLKGESKDVIESISYDAEVSWYDDSALALNFSDAKKIDWDEVKDSCFVVNGRFSTLNFGSTREGELKGRYSSRPHFEVNPSVPDCQVPNIQPPRPLEVSCEVD